MKMDTSAKEKEPRDKTGKYRFSPLNEGYLEKLCTLDKHADIPEICTNANGKLASMFGIPEMNSMKWISKTIAGFKNVKSKLYTLDEMVGIIKSSKLEEDTARAIELAKDITSGGYFQIKDCFVGSIDANFKISFKLGEPDKYQLVARHSIDLEGDCY